MHANFFKWTVVRFTSFLLKKVYNVKPYPSTNQEKQLVGEIRSFCRDNPEEDFKKLHASEREWIKISNKLKKKILTKDPREFLRWNIIIETMTPLFAPYLSYELNFLKNLTNWKDCWSNVIIESNIGHPIPYFKYPKSSGNVIHQAYALAEFETRTGTSINSLDLILQFGGGYGCMARLAKKLGFNGTYIIFDLPLISALQKFYLKTNNIPISQESLKEIICLSDIKALKTVLSNKSFERSLFIANWSLSEAPIELRLNILSLISQFHFFLISYQDDFKGINNVSFFNNWVEQIKDRYQFQKWKVPYFLKNTYLVGQIL